ncbi:MAG: ATP-dependent helicase [Gemmatimonas sp.]
MKTTGWAGSLFDDAPEENKPAASASTPQNAPVSAPAAATAAAPASAPKAESKAEPKRAEFLRPQKPDISAESLLARFARPQPNASTPASVTAGLNPAQEQAVLHNDGPMLVLAGAGSGKTRVLTARIARLIAERGVAPHEILAVTFTNKAAGEMRERIARQLGYEPKGMWCGTFHSLGARLLRGVAAAVGRTAQFTIYDEDDTLGALKRIMERRGLNPKQFAPQAILGAISDAKNALVSPTEYATTARDTFSTAVSGVYFDLDLALQRANAVTFDDLLVLPVRAFEIDPNVLEHYKRRFRYVLVDEYQDTNQAQFKFVQLIGSGHNNVMVVGDDDQSIYGWRGADIRNILEFERGFPGADIVRLEENYRSTPNILKLANKVIEENTERRGKTLRATRPAGENISLVETLDERDEAEFVADVIEDRTGTGDWLRRECAVLYRTNAQSRSIEDSLRRRNIPYRLVGAVRFYDRREIRDLMAYLKLIANPSDDEAFRRAVSVPRRGLGDSTVAIMAEQATAHRLPMMEVARRPELTPELRTAARSSLDQFVTLIDQFRVSAADMAVNELLENIVKAIRFEDHLKAEGEEGKDRINNVQELIAGAGEVVADDGGEVGLTPLDHFLQGAQLVAQTDKLDPTADAVTMMTMHNAKGLEFPLVFICGLEDGLFPLARAAEDPKQLEEERRLFYVGITRAEKKLYLTTAEQRRRYGELMMSQPSRFLRAIPPGFVEKQRTQRQRSEGRSQYAGGVGSAGSRGGDSDGWGRSSYSSGGGGSRYGSASYGSGGGSRSGGDIPFGKAPGGLSGSRPPARVTREVAPEDESQDEAVLRVGERVKHAKFGSGTIAELTGSGRDAKVRIDFDDEEIGRKTLVIAQAKLERGWE